PKATECNLWSSVTALVFNLGLPGLLLSHHSWRIPNNSVSHCSYRNFDAPEGFGLFSNCGRPGGVVPNHGFARTTGEHSNRFSSFSSASLRLASRHPIVHHGRLSWQSQSFAQ